MQRCPPSACVRKAVARLSIIVLTASLVLSLVACGSADGSRSKADMPRVLAEGGCFDAEVQPVDHDPPVSLADIEDDVRQHLNSFVDDYGFPYTVGDLVWAKYGEVVAGGYTGHGGRFTGHERWALVFETEPDSWLTRLRNRNLPNRWTALYTPEESMVTITWRGRSGYARRTV